MDKNIRIVVLGKRKGLLKALKNLNLNHIVIKDFQSEYLSLSESEKREKLRGVSHVIASGEGTVSRANGLREFLNLPSLSRELIDLCSDKLIMKEKARSLGIPTAPFLSGEKNYSSEEIYQELGKKIVVKDRRNSGGRGQKVFTFPEEVQYTKDQVLEGFIVGVEMSIESFIQEGEIRFVSSTEYFQLGRMNIIPSALQVAQEKEKRELFEKAMELNRSVLKGFQIDHGLTHLEVYLNEDKVTFGEVALRPPGGHIMPLIEEAYGIKAWEIFIKTQLAQPLSNEDFRIQKEEVAAVVIYHPGAGVITSINGEEHLESLSTLSHYSIKANVGDRIDHRIGVGQEQAHFFFHTKEANRDQLVADLDHFDSVFKMTKKTDKTEEE